MVYLLIHKSCDNEIQRTFFTSKEAQNYMWQEFNEAIDGLDDIKTLKGGDWCSIKYPDKTEETWDIIPLDIPKNESIRMTYKTKGNNVYYITHKEYTPDFYMYKFNKVNSTLEKLGKSQNPLELEKKFIK